MTAIRNLRQGVIDIETIERATRKVRFGLDGNRREMIRQLEDARQLLRGADEQIDSGALHAIDERLLTIVSEELSEALAAAAEKQSRAVEPATAIRRQVPALAQAH